MKHLFLMSLWITFLFAERIQAQWGAGVWGGNQSCPYTYAAAPGATDESDTISELKRMRSQKKKEYNRKLKKQQDLKRKKAKLERDIKRTLKAEAAKMVFQHMDKRLDRGSWALECSVGNVTDIGSPTISPALLSSDSSNLTTINPPSPPPPPGMGSSSIFCQPRNTRSFPCQDGNVNGNQCNWWFDFCEDGGRVDGELCVTEPFIKRTATPENSMDCKEALQDYAEISDNMAELGEELSSLKQELKDYERSIESERDRLRSEEDSDEESEGCISCQARRRGYNVRAPSTLETVGSIGLSVLGGVLSYKSAKYAMDQSAQLGWPTQPYMAASVGYPLMMAGLSGMGGGIGMGGFACAGGAFGGGFGMGPYGMTGNMGLYGGMGGAFGYPSSLMGAGFGAGLYMPGMGPWGMAGPWGNSGMGSMYPSMMGGMGSMYPYMMGGMYPSMMGGMYPNMMGGMGSMYPGMMGMGGMYSGTLGGYDMQTQMQQMQVYMAQQQQAQQDSMLRYQSIQRLQSELLRIQMQIQQISYGGSYSGSTYGLGSTYPFSTTTLPSSSSSITTTPSVDTRGGNIR